VLLVLLVVTVAAGAYLYVSHRGPSGPPLARDFVSVDQRVASGARGLPAAASKVQRFDELRGFDLDALKILARMGADRQTLQRIARTQTGPQRQIADRAATMADQALNAGLLYRKSVALTYNLTAADRSEATLLNAATILDQQATAWQKH
jgi:hypothetical protein